MEKGLNAFKIILTIIVWIGGFIVLHKSGLLQESNDGESYTFLGLAIIYSYTVLYWAIVLRMFKTDNK